VTWNTDKAADSQIEWGTSSAEDGDYTNISDVDTTMSRAHIGVLSDLEPTTTYYFRVRSTDIAGNSAYSDEQTVQSAAEDTIIITRSRSGAGDAAAKTAPTINNITVDANAFDANIRVTTNPDTRVVIDYGEISSSTPNAPYTLSAGSSGLGSSNDIKLYNLKPNGSYHFTATVVDGNGNMTKSKEQTFTTEFVTENLSNRSLLDRASDLQNRLDDLIQSALPSILPPFIDTPVVSSTTENGAVISWKTNIKAYGLVAYAADAKFVAGSSEYTDQITDELATTSLTHSIALTGLQPNTRYHFSVRSFVFPQVVGKSADFTFTTKSAPVKPQVQP
jgi:hypothetical protein